MKCPSGESDPEVDEHTISESSNGDESDDDDDESLLTDQEDLGDSISENPGHHEPKGEHF